METQNMGGLDSKLREFFISQLQDIYWAERKLVKTLPKLEAAATTIQLKQAFANHLEQTKEHITRLQQVFGLIGEEPRAQRCPAMAGIAEEGEEIIDETDPGSAQRDAGLIFAAQKAEHYEIATYGGMVTLAATLGFSEATDILHGTLAEEKEADQILTYIAENDVNYQASREPKDI